MKKVDIPADLFIRISAGDDDAFEQLYRLTYKPLFAFLLSLSENYEDARDLLQETYIRIHGSCHLYRDQGNPMAWMMKISRNLFLMKKRHEKKDPAAQAFEIREDDILFECIEDVETRILIEQLFKCVSGTERSIIVMHSLMGLKYREVAAELNMPLGTVLTKYRRAMKKLEQTASLKVRDQI